MTKEEIRDKIEDIYIKETERFAFLDPNKIDIRYVEWLEGKLVKKLTIPDVVGRSEQLVCCENCIHFDKENEICDETCINWSAFTKEN